MTNWDHPLFLVLLDGPRFHESNWDAVASVMSFADALVVRYPGTHSRGLWELALEVRHVASEAALWVDGPLEVALALGAEGWHLPSTQIPASLVRRHWTGRLSAAAHTPEEASWHHGADLLVWGHAFRTRSKPNVCPRQNLASVLLRSETPIVAIGGITRDTAPLLSGQGLRGVVVADGVWSTPDPVQAARQIRAAIDAPGWLHTK